MQTIDRATRPPRRRVTAAAALIALIGSAAASAATEYRFDVYYGDRVIGEHRWRISEQDGLARVTSRARFEVKVLFVPVYRYRHSAEEQWRDGCLTRMAAVTDDNGHQQRVVGSREPAPELTALTDADEATRVHLADQCVGSFAYWDLERLEHPRLVNVQTGEIVTASLLPRGDTTYLGQEAIRYELRAGDLPPLHLWYRREDRQWLGLETQRDGATITYRLATVDDLPPDALDPTDPIQAPSI